MTRPITVAELETVARRIVEAEPDTTWPEALEIARALIVWAGRP